MLDHTAPVWDLLRQRAEVVLDESRALVFEVADRVRLCADLCRQSRDTQSARATDPADDWPRPGRGGGGHPRPDPSLRRPHAGLACPRWAPGPQTIPVSVPWSVLPRRSAVP